MKSYIGVEYKNCVATGRELTFLADCLSAAVQMCLYTLSLSNGHAKMGPTERVVHSNDLCIVF